METQRFLEGFEIARLQIVNQFFYKNIVSHIQTSIKMPIEGTFKTKFLTAYWDSQTLKNKVVAYNHNKEIKLYDFAGNDLSINREWYSRQFAETEIFQLDNSADYSRIISLEDGAFVIR